MKGMRLLSMVFALSAALYALPSRAVCFYPHSDLSGYHVPLKHEIRTSQVIIVGRVVRVNNVQADPSDPDGITSYVYTVHRLQTLKGDVPKYVTLSVENDSGSYRMNLGETDLLFLTKDKSGLFANACGNSTELPKGASVLAEVRSLLARQRVQP